MPIILALRKLRQEKHRKSKGMLAHMTKLGQSFPQGETLNQSKAKQKKTQ